MGSKFKNIFIIWSPSQHASHWHGSVRRERVPKAAACLYFHLAVGDRPEWPHSSSLHFIKNPILRPLSRRAT